MKKQHVNAFILNFTEQSARMNRVVCAKGKQKY